MAYKVEELTLFDLGKRIAKILLTANSRLSIKDIQLKLERQDRIFAKLSEVRSVINKFTELSFIKLMDDGKAVIVEVIKIDAFALLASSSKVVKNFFEIEKK